MSSYTMTSQVGKDHKQELQESTMNSDVIEFFLAEHKIHLLVL